MPLDLRSRSLARTAALLVLATVTGGRGVRSAARGAGSRPGRFEADIAAFESEDRATPPPRERGAFRRQFEHPLLGSRQGLSGWSCDQTGFGGSHVSDNIYYADRIIVRYNPALIVFYAGDADVAAGKTSVQIAADYRALIALIHSRLPNARIIVIGTKHSPAHWEHLDVIRQANASAAALAAADDLAGLRRSRVRVLGTDGFPRADYYAENGLNLNERGYAAWTAAVAPVIEQHWPKP